AAGTNGIDGWHSRHRGELHAWTGDLVRDRRRERWNGRGTGRRSPGGKGICRPKVWAVPLHRRKGQPERSSRRGDQQVVNRRDSRVDYRRQRDDGEDQGDAQARDEAVRVTERGRGRARRVSLRDEKEVGPL